MTAPLTRKQIEAAIEVTRAIADAIRDLGTVPEGHLYARVMGQMSLSTFTKIIDTLVGADLVRRSNHELTWIGPPKEAGK